MATTFKVKRSAVSGVVPTTGDVDVAELAINLADKKLFTSNGSTVVELGSNLTSLAVNNDLKAANLTLTTNVATIGSAVYSVANGNVGIGNSSPTFKLRVEGAISDVAGDLRYIPISAQTTAYTITANDAGDCVSTNTSVTVNGALLTAGFVSTIYNNSAANISIVAGANTTLQLSGTSLTGNRTLTQRGLATILCVAANTVVISGAGLV